MSHNFSDSLEVESCRSQELSNCGEAFSVSISTPGKVILFGEHSVVYGKLAIAAALGLRTKLTFCERELTEISNSKVNITLNSVNLIHCYDLEDLITNLFDKTASVLKNITIEKPENANHETILETIEEFIKKNSGSVPLSKSQHLALVSLFYLLTAMVGSAKITVKPFDLTVTTDLSVSSGLGSSASYLVSLAAAFLEYVKFKGDKQKKGGLQGTRREKSFSKKDLSLISKWAYSAEKIIHGTPSGLDNTICTYGSLVEFRKNSLLKPIELHHKLQILLVNTKVPKDTKALVAKVAALKQKHPSVVDNILSAMESISNLALLNFLELDDVSASTKLTLEECQKKIGEIYGNIGDLIDFNQNLLRGLKVSHSCLDQICTVLAEYGLQSKLTGAGGGGYAFAIVPAGFSKSVLEEAIEKLKSQGFDTVLTDLGCPGVAFI